MVLLGYEFNFVFDGSSVGINIGVVIYGSYFYLDGLMLLDIEYYEKNISEAMMFLLIRLDGTLYWVMQA